MKRKVLFVVCIVVGLLFVNAGLNKFFNYMPVPDDLPKGQMDMFVAISQIGWLLPLVGAVEIAGGILLMIPRLRALGALVLLPVVVGIVLTHFTVAPEGIPMALIIAAVLAWVIIENRVKYTALLQS